MKTISFDTSDGVLTYLQNGIAAFGEKFAEYLEEKRANETDEDEDEFEEWNNDMAKTLFPEIEELNVKLIYDGHELDLSDEYGVYYLAGCALGWLESCWRYDEDNGDFENDFEGYMSNCVKHHAIGYLNGIAKK